MSYQPTQAEREELADLQAYLRGHAEAGTTPKEGSFSRVIRNASPNVKQFILQSRDFAKFIREDGGRTMPFTDRLTLDENKLAPAERALLGKMDEEEISAKLMERMGTTQSQQRIHREAPTMRDHLDAAFSAHTEHEGADHD